MTETQTSVEVAEARVPGRQQAINIIGLTLVGLVVLWMIYELITSPSQFITLFLDGVNNGALYALVALGYTLVYGIIELINFSHGDLFMLATVFAGMVLITGFGAQEASVTAFGLMAFVLILTMIAAAALNMGAERVAYRRLRRAPKLAPLITAVGLSFIYQWLGLRTWGPWGTGSTPKQWDTLIGNRQFTIGTIDIRWSTVVVVGVTIPLLIGLQWIVQQTRQGKAMRATAQDQDAARLMGIDVDRTIAFTFGLGGAMAGAAGMLWVESVGTTRYDLGFQLGLIAFTAAVLGGIGNLNGAVLGGFLIGIIQALNDGLGFGQKWSQTVVFTILIALMVFRPEGILGKPTTEKV
jgi:branched-chain amino acid transport system permease protein